MNKWIKEATAIDLHFNRPDQFYCTLTDKCKNAHDTIASPAWSGTVKDYALTLKLEVRFSCYDGAFDAARDGAKRRMLASVYGDLHKHLMSLRAAIHGGDRAACMSIVAKIEREMLHVD